MQNNRQPLLRNGVIAAGAAAAANTALYGAAHASGVDFVVDNGSLTTVTVGQAVVSSAVPILLGSAVAALARHRRHVRRLENLALAITLLSLGAPLSMGVGAGTKLALAAMHVVAGLAFVAGTRRATVAAPEQPAKARHADDRTGGRTPVASRT